VPMQFLAEKIGGLRQMEIGGNVTYNGKCYVLRGVEPMGVADRRADLEDPETGELISVPVAFVDEARSDGV
jgi:hypothetical protein